MKVAKLKNIGSRQLDILRHLAFRGRPCPMLELKFAAADPDEHRTCTYKAIRRLEDRDLIMVRRGEEERDRRQATVLITPAGAELLRAEEEALFARTGEGARIDPRRT